MKDSVQRLINTRRSDILYSLMTRVRESPSLGSADRPSFNIELGTTCNEMPGIVNVKCDSDLSLLKSDTIKATIWNRVGSHQSMSSQEFSCYVMLEDLIIGNDCFQHVLSFILEDMHHLKTVKIGKSCFCKPASAGECIMKSANFEVKNCEVLTSVKIEDDSFVDMVKVTFESELYWRVIMTRLAFIDKNRFGKWCVCEYIETDTEK